MTETETTQAVPIDGKPEEEALPPLPKETEVETAVIENGTDPILEALQRLQESQREQFRQLQQSFDSKIKYDTKQKELFDSLHQDLQRHQEGLHINILRPVFKDLITLYDDVEKMLEKSLAETENEQRLKRNLASFKDSIEDILDRYDVEIFRSEVGGDLAGKQQRAVKTVETANESLNKKVAQSLRPGFRYGDRILRPENVVTYEFSPPSPAEATELGPTTNEGEAILKTV